MVASIPCLGIGKSVIVASAIARSGDRNKTVLVAVSPALQEQWSEQILQVDPTASVFFYGLSEAGGKRYRSFTELKPKPKMSYTFDYLAKVPAWEWKTNRSTATYFLATFPNIQGIADVFAHWFDFAIQDEYSPNVAMKKVRDGLQCAAKRVVRVVLQPNPPANGN